VIAQVGANYEHEPAFAHRTPVPGPFFLISIPARLGWMRGAGNIARMAPGGERQSNARRAGRPPLTEDQRADRNELDALFLLMALIAGGITRRWAGSA
jgi:hypothetical protein